MSHNRTDPLKTLMLFPVMVKTAEAFPIPDDALTSPKALRAWGESARIGESGTHVINLVCGVIDNRGSNTGGFDLFGAMGKWDAEHHAAFRAWIAAAYD